MQNEKHVQELLDKGNSIETLTRLENPPTISQEIHMKPFDNHKIEQAIQTLIDCSFNFEQLVVQKWLDNGIPIHSLIDSRIPITGHYVQNKDQLWYQDGKLHRTDGPALIWASGTQQWYQDGKLHRTDGPAIICADGTQQWFQNGQLHRLDGPAIIYPEGTQYWYLHGKYHREDGPAIILENGPQEWYLHGKRHREDGPAVIWADGHQEWWLNGKFHREDDSAVIEYPKV